MTKAELPKGVSSDNNSRSSMSGDEFQAPDMATPHFSQSVSKPAMHNERTALNKATHHTARGAYDEDDDEIMTVRSKSVSASGGNNILIILILVIALFAMSAGIFIIRNQNAMPLCSTQPDWNQFNCRAG